MPTITNLSGQEILDSRGRPTVKATVTLTGGTVASASVPSGASTGEAEARELRDGNPKRYGGLGCRKAIALLEGEIRDALSGATFDHPFALDRRLIALDGTPDKSRLGANSLLAVSLAFARAAAREAGMPLYQYFAGLLGHQPTHLPHLTVNLFSGGLHAGGQIPIQDCLVVPIAAASIDESLSTTYDVFQAAAQLIRERYGMRLLTADEGGLSPEVANASEMLDLGVEAIHLAGYQPGREVALAVDVAASHFYSDGQYHLQQPLSPDKMIDWLESLVDTYPIVSLEDGLAEEDWMHWPRLLERCADRTAILGDDLLCTNVSRIQRAIDTGAANALLLKVNQIGTLYEAAEALQLAKRHGWMVTVSARSGETEDDWLADLAVGWGADFIKIGSITQSERLAKYNRLLEIERASGLRLKKADR